MKKVTLLFVMLLTTLIASAQSIVGNWETTLQDKDTSILCLMTFNGNKTMAMKMSTDIVDQDLGTITLAAKVDGTYQKNGETLSLNFDTESITMEIEDLNFKEEVKEMMEANPAIEKQITDMLGEGLKAGLEEMVKSFPLNGDSTIKEVSNQQLILIEGDEDIVFIRK